MKSLLLASSLAVVGLGLSGFGPDTEKSADKHARAFLSQAISILQENPDDGRFGMSRLPTIHGRQGFSSKDSFEDIAVNAMEELGKTHYVALIGVGNFDKNGVGQRKSHMSGYYQLNFATLNRSDAHFKAEDNFHQVLVPTESTKLFKSRRMESSVKVDYAGAKATLLLKKVIAPSEQCGACHSGAKKGDTIGVLALLRVPK